MDKQNHWRLAAWAIRCDSRTMGFLAGEGAFGELSGKAIAARVNQINAPIHGGAAGWPADLGFDGDAPSDLDFLTYASAAEFIRDIVMASRTNSAQLHSFGDFGPLDGSVIESFATERGLALAVGSEVDGVAAEPWRANAIAARFELMFESPELLLRKRDYDDWRPLAWAIFCESRYAGHDREGTVFGNVAYEVYIKRIVQFLDWRYEPGSSMPKPADLAFARSNQIPLSFLSKQEAFRFVNAIRLEGQRCAASSRQPDWLPIPGAFIKDLALEHGLAEPAQKRVDSSSSARASAALAADEMFVAFEKLLADPARQEALRRGGTRRWATGHGDDDVVRRREDDRRREDQEDDERRRRDDEEQQRRDDEDRDERRREEADRWREEQHERLWRD